MSEGPEPALVLTRAAGSAKAALGPTAWAVLEELTLGAEQGRDGRLLVTTSVRRLAAALSLDKDTVARALVRLTADGFVLRRSRERPANASCYVLASISGLALVGVGANTEPVVQDTAVRPWDGDRPRRPEVGDGARPRRSRRVRDGDGGAASQAGQLSLLGEDVAPNDTTTSSSSPTPHPPISITDAPKDPAQSSPDLEPDDDHNHRHPTSPIQHPDSCHPSGGADAAGPGGSRGGGAERC